MKDLTPKLRDRGFHNYKRKNIQKNIFDQERRIDPVHNKSNSVSIAVSQYKQKQKFQTKHKKSEFRERERERANTKRQKVENSLLPSIPRKSKPISKNAPLPPKFKRPKAQSLLPKSRTVRDNVNFSSPSNAERTKQAKRQKVSESKASKQASRAITFPNSYILVVCVVQAVLVTLSK